MSDRPFENQSPLALLAFSDESIKKGDLPTLSDCLLELSDHMKDKSYLVGSCLVIAKHLSFYPRYVEQVIFTYRDAFICSVNNTGISALIKPAFDGLLENIEAIPGTEDRQQTYIDVANDLLTDCGSRNRAYVDGCVNNFAERSIESIEAIPDWNKRIDAYIKVYSEANYKNDVFRKRASYGLSEYTESLSGKNRVDAYEHIFLFSSSEYLKQNALSRICDHAEEDIPDISGRVNYYCYVVKYAKSDDLKNRAVKGILMHTDNINVSDRNAAFDNACRYAPTAYMKQQVENRRQQYGQATDQNAERTAAIRFVEANRPILG